MAGQKNLTEGSKGNEEKRACFAIFFVNFVSFC